MADIERALADAREARESHVNWADHMRDLREGGYDVELHRVQPIAGSEREHRDWIERYDNIIACLECRV